MYNVHFPCCIVLHCGGISLFVSPTPSGHWDSLQIDMTESCSTLSTLDGPFGEDICVFLLYMYLGVELLGHIVCVYIMHCACIAWRALQNDSMNAHYLLTVYKSSICSTFRPVLQFFPLFFILALGCPCSGIAVWFIITFSWCLFNLSIFLTAWISSSCLFKLFACSIVLD